MHLALLLGYLLHKVKKTKQDQNTNTKLTTTMPAALRPFPLCVKSSCELFTSLPYINQNINSAVSDRIFSLVLFRFHVF